MHPTPMEVRKDRLVAMRASHDEEMQRILRREGLDLSEGAQPVEAQLRQVAADQRQRIEEAVADLERDSGRSMSVYDRVLVRAENEWARDQDRIARDASRKAQGQLADAQSALASGRTDRFERIRAEVQRDAKAQEAGYKARQIEIRDRLSGEVAAVDPGLPSEARIAIATTAAEMRPVPKPVLELDQLPRQIEEAQRTHERQIERESRQQNRPDSAPAPGR